MPGIAMSRIRQRVSSSASEAVILGAAAVRTRRIRLTSAVTILSAEDPVRAFQNFATIDLLSGGRAEMVVGRGSSIEAFPLFELLHNFLHNPGHWQQTRGIISDLRQKYGEVAARLRPSDPAIFFAESVRLRTE
jgi:alkanesulfonate monooxygenase SsuD/methylene tetrahydromethanopterin reductase-like flavin-dependent oxidoreductase (luciferase family)